MNTGRAEPGPAGGGPFQQDVLDLLSWASDTLGAGPVGPRLCKEADQDATTTAAA